MVINCHLELEPEAMGSGAASDSEDHRFELRIIVLANTTAIFLSQLVENGNSLTLNSGTTQATP